MLTSLTKEAMPVVRYRTRDLTRLLPGTAYPSFRRMAKVTGRTDDMMILRGVNLFPSQVEELILEVEGLSGSTSPRDVRFTLRRGEILGVVLVFRDATEARRAQENAERLAAIVRRNPNVERILCGHVHRPIQVRFAGTIASVAPSTAHQATLEDVFVSLTGRMLRDG